ncbi:MAG: type II toxin-antitoxin system ParD family antitoxin [Alphaproteobacteria bacterium]|nr:type II toxin-antitoxin system ParD family antitoxin [Alphaproteobacteria bacterium]
MSKRPATPSIKPKSVALGTHFEGFIKQQVKSGRYNNDSEVVREGLRLLEEREQERAIRLQKLRGDIQKGIDSGRGKPADKVLDRLTRKYQGKSE